MDIKTMYRNSFLKIVAPTVLIGAVLLMGCGDPTSPKSGEAEITELTVSLGGNNYPVSFDADNMAELIAAGAVPQSITVKSAAISAGATGLAKGNTFSVPANGEVAITVTAEDGTTEIRYTLVPAGIAADEIAKDKRYHSAAFAIQFGGGADVGRVKFGLKETAETAPTAQEPLNGDGIYHNGSQQEQHPGLHPPASGPM